MKEINTGSPPSEDSQPRLNSEAARERRMRGARTRARAEKGPQRAVSRRRFSSKNAAALSEECERAAEIPAPPERCFFRDPQSICIRHFVCTTCEWSRKESSLYGPTRLRVINDEHMRARTSRNAVRRTKNARFAVTRDKSKLQRDRGKKFNAQVCSFTLAFSQVA